MLFLCRTIFFFFNLKLFFFSEGLNDRAEEDNEIYLQKKRGRKKKSLKYYFTAARIGIDSFFFFVACFGAFFNMQIASGWLNSSNSWNLDRHELSRDSAEEQVATARHIRSKLPYFFMCPFFFLVGG